MKKKFLAGSLCHALTKCVFATDGKVYQTFTITKKIASKQGFHKPFIMSVSRKRALNEKHNSA